VTDIKRSLAFYVDVLGLSLEGSSRTSASISFDAPQLNRPLRAAAGASLGQGLQRGIDHLCLNVRGDMNEIVEYLAQNKIEMASPLRELHGATGFGTLYIFSIGQIQIELKANYSQYRSKSPARKRWEA